MFMKSVIFSVFAMSLLVSAPASAQSRPLVTEDAETVPAGNILLEAGFDFDHGRPYPVSGLKGNLTRIGTFGLSFGVSSIAEIQLDGGFRNRLSITERDASAPLAGLLDVPEESTSDFEDLRVGAKIRLASETASRPSIAVRFSTKLPNAGNESGLGMDTTDFHFGLAFAKTVNSIRVVGNGGFAILPDPVRGDRQNDVLEYGLSVARAVRPAVEVIGEINGRINTRSGEAITGTESRSVLRLGARATHGPVRVDGAFALGITEFDPSWGFSTGITWVFRGFTVP